MLSVCHQDVARNEWLLTNSMRYAEPRGYKALVAPPLITPRPVHPRSDTVASDLSSVPSHSGGDVSAVSSSGRSDQDNKAARSGGNQAAQQPRDKSPFAAAAAEPAPKAAPPAGAAPPTSRGAKGEAGNDARGVGEVGDHNRHHHRHHHHHSRDQRRHDRGDVHGGCPPAVPGGKDGTPGGGPPPAHPVFGVSQQHGVAQHPVFGVSQQHGVPGQQPHGSWKETAPAAGYAGNHSGGGSSSSELMAAAALPPEVLSHGAGYGHVRADTHMLFSHEVMNEIMGAGGGPHHHESPRSSKSASHRHAQESDPAACSSKSAAHRHAHAHADPRHARTPPGSAPRGTKRAAGSSPPDGSGPTSSPQPAALPQPAAGGMHGITPSNRHAGGDFSNPAMASGDHHHEQPLQHRETKSLMDKFRELELAFKLNNPAH